MSNNTVHVRTCSDSCSALLQLIQYIAADGDLVPSYEPEEPDATKAPSVSDVTHSSTNLVHYEIEELESVGNRVSRENVSCV